MKPKDNRTMLTDMYQLTMNAAYFDHGRKADATFDLFVRKLPEDWGFLIANGIEDAIDYATNIRFEEEDIEYLRGQGIFKEEYLGYLRDFKFTGEIHAVQEGTPLAANTPLMRVTAPIAQAQLLETMLLNTINFQTMIASKTNRIVNVAEPAAVVEFGLRRAQEKDAAMKGARAAYIAGAKATSNVFAGKEYGIPVTGTQAHSFVMAFSDELEAFRKYVQTFPDETTLLIDTYDTLQGARNAAQVGKELEQRGKRLGAVRLDSGDLAELSKEVRQILDGQGLDYVQIVASNDLNEYRIKRLIENGARIDGYGVGTEMITAKPVAAIPGVYKLVEDENGPKIKLSEGKKSYPGRKQLYRVEENGEFSHDILAIEGEPIEGTPLLEARVQNGQRITPRRTLEETREYCFQQVSQMPGSSREIRATPYEFRESQGLTNLITQLTKQYGGTK